MVFILIFVVGGLCGASMMALLQFFSKEDNKTEIVYADDPIRRFAVRYEELTRPVMDLHYTIPIHQETFEHLDTEGVQDMVYRGLKEQIIPALNIKVYQNPSSKQYIVSGCVYVVKGTGIQEVVGNADSN